MRQFWETFYQLLIASVSVGNIERVHEVCLDEIYVLLFTEEIVDRVNSCILQILLPYQE